MWRHPTSPFRFKSKLTNAILSLNPPEFVLPLSIRISQSDQSYMTTRVVFIGVQARTNVWQDVGGLRDNSATTLQLQITSHHVKSNNGAQQPHSTFNQSFPCRKIQAAVFVIGFREADWDSWNPKKGYYSNRVYFLLWFSCRLQVRLISAPHITVSCAVENGQVSSMELP